MKSLIALIALIIGFLRVNGQIYFNSRNDAADLIQSAFELAEDPSSRTIYSFKPSSPIPLFTRRRPWRFRFPFASFKDKSTGQYYYTPSTLGYLNPLKFNFDHSYQPFWELYHSSRLSFPNVYGLHPNSFMNSYQKLPSDSVPIDIVDVYNIPKSPSPASSSLIKSSSLPPSQSYSFSSSNTKVNKAKNKLNSIKYLYGGFKPIPAPSISSVSYSSFESNTTNSSENGHNEENKNWSSHQLFHPAKIENVSKISLPINPNDLLKLVNEEKKFNSNTNCVNKDLGWCDLENHYPEEFVNSVIKDCRKIVDKMYIEVPDNLADFDDYVPFAPSTSKNNSQESNEAEKHTTWSWAGYRTQSLCNIDRKFIRPIIAQDINGSWFLIVQTSLYHQQVPIEICKDPGGVCNNITNCGVNARCVQKFHTQLLISIDLDKENECPIMKLYRFPSACVCDYAKYQ